MPRTRTRLSALCLAILWSCASEQPLDRTPNDNADGDENTAAKTSGDLAADGSKPDADHATKNVADYPDLRGKCDIHSDYPGDQTCLPPPPAGEGMQIHVGPTDYKDMEQVKKFLLHPGEERSECWTFHTPNDEPIYYQTFVISGRPGTHHIINTMFTDTLKLEDGGFTVCADPGTGMNGNIIDNLPGASKAYMPRGHVAPENEHVGRKIPAHAASQADMHYFNFTDHDILREFWMNIYFAKNDEITEEAQQIRGMGGFSWIGQPIPPRSDKVYSYSCPITGDGRILALLGHYHSHGKQFTASIKRKDGTIDKVFEMFDYMDPATFEYDSIRQNPAFSDGNAGAMSGVLDVHDGDTLVWDCHIVNDSDVGLTYRNEVKTGEMCNLYGTSLDVNRINCVLP